MPGLRKFNNITLRRGVVKGDNEFFTWMNSIHQNNVQRRNVSITLLDEDHQPIRIYKIHKAWPCKIESSNLNATGNDVAMETIELAHEGLTIEAV
jgi:phage tail-like protein